MKPFVTPSLIGSINDRVFTLTNQQAVLIGSKYSIIINAGKSHAWFYNNYFEDTC